MSSDALNAGCSLPLIYSCLKLLSCNCWLIDSVFILALLSTLAYWNIRNKLGWVYALYLHTFIACNLASMKQFIFVAPKIIRNYYLRTSFLLWVNFHDVRKIEGCQNLSYPQCWKSNSDGGNLVPLICVSVLLNVHCGSIVLISLH